MHQRRLAGLIFCMMTLKIIDGVPGQNLEFIVLMIYTALYGCTSEGQVMPLQAAGKQIIVLSAAEAAVTTYVRRNM